MNLPAKIRPKTIYVSNEVYYSLKAIADVEGRDCVDVVAEELLTDTLGKDPRSARRVVLFLEAMKTVSAQLRSEFDEKIPGL